MCGLFMIVLLSLWVILWRLFILFVGGLSWFDGVCRVEKWGIEGL